MYHSIATLVLTGAVLTAGSNPQGQYAFQSDPGSGVFPSELRVEYYYPWCAPGLAGRLLSHLKPAVSAQSSGHAGMSALPQPLMAAQGVHRKWTAPSLLSRQVGLVIMSDSAARSPGSDD